MVESPTTPHHVGGRGREEVRKQSGAHACSAESAGSEATEGRLRIIHATEEGGRFGATETESAD